MVTHIDVLWVTFSRRGPEPGEKSSLGRWGEAPAEPGEKLGRKARQEPRSTSLKLPHRFMISKPKTPKSGHRPQASGLQFEESSAYLTFPLGLGSSSFYRLTAFTLRAGGVD